MSLRSWLEFKGDDVSGTSSRDQIGLISRLAEPWRHISVRKFCHERGSKRSRALLSFLSITFESPEFEMEGIFWSMCELESSIDDNFICNACGFRGGCEFDDGYFASSASELSYLDLYFVISRMKCAGNIQSAQNLRSYMKMVNRWCYQLFNAPNPSTLKRFLAGLIK